MKPLWPAVVILLSSPAAFATTRVCVSVQQKSWYRPTAPPAARVTPAPGQSPTQAPAPEGPAERPQSPPPPPPAPPAPPAYGPMFPYSPPVAEPAPRPRPGPHEIDPTLYLKRMLEYEVTHEVGFAAVSEGCQQQLSVELYQLESGWTVFARYSGTEREEKVAHADIDEFVELAQRLAFALLRNQPVGQTITRENVLRADSERDLRTIEGTGHLLFGMGTEVRLARLPTAQGVGAPAADELRILTPASLQIGYRRKLKSWGFDVFGRFDLGTENTGIHQNDLGGHVDYTFSLASGLHFLHYLDPAGINSLYVGGGASFELAFFDVVRPAATRTLSGDRDGLVAGGLNVDLLIGYEFLRVSSIHFFGQLELDIPTYIINTENDTGAVDTYMPGAVAQIGVIF
jgi:hypothetical protein